MSIRTSSRSAEVCRINRLYRGFLHLERLRIPTGQLPRVVLQRRRDLTPLGLYFSEIEKFPAMDGVSLTSFETPLYSGFMIVSN
jgi:hypothetical protein